MTQTLTTESDAAINWFTTNMMEANPCKFQGIILKNRDATTFSIAGNSIETEDTVTLLGVLLDKDLNFNEQIKILCHKAAAQLAVLQRLSGYLDFNSRMAIFQVLYNFEFQLLRYCLALLREYKYELERLQF